MSKKWKNVTGDFLDLQGERYRGCLLKVRLPGLAEQCSSTPTVMTGVVQYIRRGNGTAYGIKFFGVGNEIQIYPREIGPEGQVWWHKYKGDAPKPPTPPEVDAVARMLKDMLSGGAWETTQYEVQQQWVERAKKVIRAVDFARNVGTCGPDRKPFDPLMTPGRAAISTDPRRDRF